MSAAPQSIQQLQQDLQNEVTTSNQLLRLISLELEQIKQLTGPNGEFESNIKQNAALMLTLAAKQKIDLQNLPPFTRTHMEVSNDDNQNLLRDQNGSNMDDTQ